MCFLRQCCTHSFAAMLHSQFVPHSVVHNAAKNWLGLGHAAFVQKSWLPLW